MTTATRVPSFGSRFFGGGSLIRSRRTTARERRDARRGRTVPCEISGTEMGGGTECDEGGARGDRDDAVGGRSAACASERIERLRDRPRSPSRASSQSARSRRRGPRGSWASACGSGSGGSTLLRAQSCAIVSPSERRAARDETEEDGAERPDVGARIHLARCEAARAPCRAASPSRRSRVSALSSSFGSFEMPKSRRSFVRLVDAAREEQVVGLEVAMDDPSPCASAIASQAWRM